MPVTVRQDRHTVTFLNQELKPHEISVRKVQRYYNMTAKATPFAPSLRQSIRHGSVGGSSKTPVQDATRDVGVKAKDNSKTLVFGGLAVIGAGAVWWMMADTGDPSKPRYQQTAGQGQPVAKH
ncbi:hypothetical protein JCM3770_002304 [Rhodotorula araucariae]